MFQFKIYRNCDVLRIRKVVIELLHNGELIDKRRMFAGPLFLKRLMRKQKRMLKLAKKMLALSGEAK